MGKKLSPSKRYIREVLRPRTFERVSDTTWVFKGWDAVIAISARYPKDMRLILRHPDRDTGKMVIEQTRRFRSEMKALEYADMLAGLMQTYAVINADTIDAATAIVEKQLDMMPLQMVA